MLWVVEVEFDVDWYVISKLSSNKIAELAKRGAGRVECALALHYRFHAELDQPKFADEIDVEVFGGPYASVFGTSVFR